MNPLLITRKVVSRTSASLRTPARWGTPVPVGLFTQATPGPGLGRDPPRRVPAPFGAAAEHRGSAATAVPGSPQGSVGLTPPPSKLGCWGGKTHTSMHRLSEGRGGVKLRATEAAPLVLIELLEDEVWRQLCAAETGSAAARRGCRSAAPPGEGPVFHLELWDTWGYRVRWGFHSRTWHTDTSDGNNNRQSHSPALEQK